MDKDAGSAVQKEQKDGFSQLAEKMEQVRTQMINMERKYDELYRTVKEKDSGSISQGSVREEAKSARGSTAETTSIGRASILTESEKTVKPEEAPRDDSAAEKNAEQEIEKLEDNPFL